MLFYVHDCKFFDEFAVFQLLLHFNVRGCDVKFKFIIVKILPKICSYSDLIEWSKAKGKYVKIANISGIVININIIVILVGVVVAAATTAAAVDVGVDGGFVISIVGSTAYFSNCILIL